MVVVVVVTASRCRRITVSQAREGSSRGFPVFRGFPVLMHYLPTHFNPVVILHLIYWIWGIRLYFTFYSTKLNKRWMWVYWVGHKSAQPVNQEEWAFYLTCKTVYFNTFISV